MREKVTIPQVFDLIRIMLIQSNPWLTGVSNVENIRRLRINNVDIKHEMRA